MPHKENNLFTMWVTMGNDLNMDAENASEIPYASAGAAAITLYFLCPYNLEKLQENI
jgi:hypothetical protein